MCKFLVFVSSERIKLEISVPNLEAKWKNEILYALSIDTEKTSLF